MTDAGAAIGVVVSSLLARTGAVRIKSHASAAPQPVTAGVSQPRSSVKRRSVDGNGGGGGNGGGAEADSHYSLTESLLLQQQQPQQTFVLPFKAFCVGFSVATLVLVALAVGKQNIPALQNPLAPWCGPSRPPTLHVCSSRSIAPSVSCDALRKSVKGDNRMAMFADPHHASSSRTDIPQRRLAPSILARQQCLVDAACVVRGTWCGLT